MAGAYGPANLLAAVRVAASPLARGLGTLMVFNDEIHAARFVRRSHSRLLVDRPHWRTIGTNALYAYEARASVRITSGAQWLARGDGFSGRDVAPRGGLAGGNFTWILNSRFRGRPASACRAAMPSVVDPLSHLFRETGHAGQAFKMIVRGNKFDIVFSGAGVDDGICKGEPVRKR